MVKSGRRFSERRGSALLIVMGMFAFMIVSAVSFSVYMRSSRTPSSFVRRNALTRQIVRAALARAIDEVDTAIGNDPFPGFGKNHQETPLPGVRNPFKDGLGDSGTATKYSDLWYGRVFTPSNVCPRTMTVPTLTLEALGYLPPPLINEVRYGSRHTRTAQWRSFNYGLGRYAFTAVNVSDFFNLTDTVDEEGNPLPVNRSSAPNARVSPLYLFSEAAAEQGNGGNSTRYDRLRGGDGAYKKFHDNMKRTTDGGTGNWVPFVSMMDYNLALGRYLEESGLESPFYKTIHGDYNESMVFDYEGRMAKIMPQMFIAGGWDGADPPDSFVDGQNYINLQNPLHQPLIGHGFPGKITFAEADHNTEFWKRTAALNSRPNRGDRSAGLVENCIPVLGQRLLADYLDCDSVPISLAIPSAEETPMIVYAELNDECVKWTVRVQEEETQKRDTSADPPQKRRVKKTFYLKVDVDADIIFGTVYPFKFRPKNDKTFKLDCFMRVFFTADSGNVWTAQGLRASGNSKLKLESGDVGDGSFKWKDIQQTQTDAYFQLKADGLNVEVKDNGVDKAEENIAVLQHSPVNCSWTPPEVAIAAIEYELDDADKPVTVVKKEIGNDLGAGLTAFEGAWDEKPITGSADDFDEVINPGGAATTIYRPSVALWVRIRNSDDRTVDMVPATPSYDNVDGDGYREVFDVGDGEGFFSAAGGGTPLLRFFPKVDADSEIQFNHKFFTDNNGSQKNVKWEKKVYSANDPRYNWAPEDWMVSDDVDPKTAGWLNKVREFQLNHRDWCDSDIFMQVSDQGYLQSMYELMMIPQVGWIADKENAVWGKLDGGQYNGVQRTTFNDALHCKLMWRTYRSDAFWRRDDDSRHYYENAEYREWGSIEDIGFIESSEGMRVNPYTDITNLFVGALANMPRDWWAAGTNFHDATVDNWNGKKDYMDPQSGDALKVKDDYLMSAAGGSEPLVREDIMDMAHFMMSEFRNNEDDANISKTNNVSDRSSWMNWSAVFNFWNWAMPRTGADEGRERFDHYNLTGQDNDMADLMADLTSVDRKFLYGYLKECFANKSQLFLIFVRAEPSDGGGGGRAVALVWRDPNPDLRANTTKDNASWYLKKMNEIVSEDTWRLQLPSDAAPPHRTRVLFYRQLD